MDIVVRMLRSNVAFNVNLLVGVSGVAAFLGFVAMLFGFANGVWIILLASSPIVWARLFRSASPDNRICGARSDAKALAGLHFEKVVLRRRTDTIALAGQSTVQGSLFEQSSLQGVQAAKSCSRQWPPNVACGRMRALRPSGVRGNHDWSGVPRGIRTPVLTVKG